MKLPYEAKAEADRRFAIIQEKIASGQQIKQPPGDMLFKVLINKHLAFLSATAVTPKQVTYQRRVKAQARWWLRFFGNMMLKEYRPKDSARYQKWYVRERKDFYDQHPWSRRQAANGAATSLSELKRVCKEFSENEETGWWPNIRVPQSVVVPAGRVIERWEQARLLKACMGGVWDRARRQWKTKIYVDDEGVTRTTWRVASRKLIARRKSYARVIRAGVRTGAREEVYSEVVWGRHNTLAHFDVNEDGAGEFRRRGLKVVDNNKSRPSSRVPQRLKYLLRIWMYEDGHTSRLIDGKRTWRRATKRKYVFGKVDGQPYSKIILSGVVRDAGLGRDISEHALRFTAVDEAHVMKLTLLEAANTLGMTPDMLLSHYTDWDRRAADARDQTVYMGDSPKAAALLRRPKENADPSDRKRNYTRDAERFAHDLEGAEDDPEGVDA